MDEAVTAFFAAIDAGDLDRVRTLVAATPALAAARDAAGVSALLHARYRGRIDIANALLGAAPPLDLFDAVAAGRDDRVAALLDADPAAACAWSPDGFTALHFAAFFDQPAAAAMLIARGADVDAVARNPMRVRPLHSAATARAIAVLAQLLERGADPNAKQQQDFTPLMAAAANGDLEGMRALLARGADAGAHTSDGRTAADIAHERKQQAAIDLLTR